MANPTLAGFRVGSVPGDQREGGRRVHQGYDVFPGAEGPEWYSDQPFEVRNVRTGSRQGITADIAFPDGTVWTAMHLRDWPQPGPGNPGELVAVAGNTGNARTTPAHFHMEGRDADGNRLDPRDYFGGPTLQSAGPGGGLNALLSGHGEQIPPPPAGFQLVAPGEGPETVLDRAQSVAQQGFVSPGDIEDAQATRRTLPEGAEVPEGMALSFPEEGRRRIANYLAFARTPEDLEQYAAQVMRDLYGYENFRFVEGQAARNLAAYRRDGTVPAFSPLTYGPDGQPLQGPLQTLAEAEQARREALSRQTIGDPRTDENGEFQQGRFVENVGDLARGFARAIGHPDANRIGREITRTAELAPITGGIQLVEDAGAPAGRGEYGTAIAMAGLGAADMIPGAGPFRNALRGAGELVDDVVVRETIRYTRRAEQAGRRHLDDLERRYAEGQYDLPAADRAALVDEITATRARLEGMERARAARGPVPVEYELPSLAARAAGRNPATGARARGPADDPAPAASEPDITVTAASRGASAGPSVDEAAPVGLTEFRREGNERFLLYRDQNGQEANIHVVLGDDGRAEISVDPFSTNPNRFGAGVIRDAARQLRELYPEIRTLHGPRESGANPGRLQEVDVSNLGPRPPSRLGADNIPPPPAGYRLVEQDGPLSGEISGGPNPLRSIRPEDVLPGARAVVVDPAELPSSIAPMDAPALGRRPARPEGFSTFLRERMADDSARLGVPVRIDAEDAISRGVPAELIYRNPNEANPARRRLLNPSLFGTRFGRMSGTQQHLRSLDMDDLDPVEWGFDAAAAGGRLEPDDVADLLRRDLEGDPSALRRGSSYDEWAAWEARAAERAEFEGRFPDGPPVERRGAPVGREDLDALEPPVSAYENPIPLDGRIGNIRLANLENPGQLERLLRVLQERVPTPRRVQSVEDTQRLAQQAGLSFDDLLARRNGQPFTAVEVAAFEPLLEWTAQRVLRLAGRARLSDADAVEFYHSLELLTAVRARIEGAKSEMGRAFNMLQHMARRDVLPHGITRDYMEAIRSGRADPIDIADKIVELQQVGVSPGNIARFAAMATQPRLQDKINQVFYFNLLSGPSTHSTNFLSNFITGIVAVPTDGVAALIGGLRHAVRVARRQDATADRVMGSEIGRRALGLIQGGREGAQSAWRSARTGQTRDPLSKLDMAVIDPIGGPVGKVLSFPSRMLAASDEGFKAWNSRVEINGLAMRRAQSEGLRGAALRERYAELVANPPEDMLLKAIDYARYHTMTRPLGKAGEHVLGILNDQPWLRLFVPFVRTLTNLGKYSVEHTPLGLFFRHVRADIRAGGAARDRAIARIVTGSSLMSLAAYYTRSGVITGGRPSDKSQAELLEAQGWQPYSIRVGGRYYSYERIAPWSTLLGLAADYASLPENVPQRELDRVAMYLLASTLKNFANPTYIPSAAGFLGALEDERAMESMMSRLASTAIPSIAAQTAGALDEYQREARGLLDRLQARIPGLRERLPVRRDVLGRPMRNDDGAASIINPMRSRRVGNDPAVDELLRLNAPIGRTSRQMTVNGVQRELTPSEYDALSELAGRYILDDLRAAMATPEWRAAGVIDRQDWFEEIKADARADARADLNLSADGVDAPPPPPGFSVPGGQQQTGPSAPAAANDDIPPPPPGFQLVQ